MLIREAFYIINRQKAEIERLEAMVDAAEEEFSPLPFKNNFDEYIEKCKAETIKEFAEKVKQSRNRLFNTIYSDYHFGEKIDQLVKEMTEDAE